MQFRVIVVTYSQTNKQTQPQTHRQDRLLRRMQLARSIVILVIDQDHQVESDRKSRSKITGLETILDHDHFTRRPKITQTYSYNTAVQCI